MNSAAPAVVRVSAKAELGAGDQAMRLTVTAQADSLWKYTISGPQIGRISYGRTTVPDHLIALRHAADILARGFEPGTGERGLLETLAKDT